MLKLNLYNNLFLKISALIFCMCMMSCEEGTSISGASQSRQPTKTRSSQDQRLGIDSKRKESKEDNKDKDDKNKDDKDDDSEKDTFEYPELNFKIPRSGENFTTCNEHDSDGTKEITADLDVSLNSKTLRANMKEMHVWVKDKYQGESDAETNKNRGLTEFFRPSSKELKKLIKNDNFDFTTTAIFADKIVQHAKNLTFNFSAPLPVFAFPVPKNRYDDLKTSKTWRATVDAGSSGTFDVAISLKKISETGDQVVVELSTYIPADTDATLYELFPIPKLSTYTLDISKKRVLQIRSINEFHPDSKHCKHGSRDRVEATYKLCSSKKDGKTDTFNCSN